MGCASSDIAAGSDTRLGSFTGSCECARVCGRARRRFGRCASPPRALSPSASRLPARATGQSQPRLTKGSTTLACRPCLFRQNETLPPLSRRQPPLPPAPMASTSAPAPAAPVEPQPSSKLSGTRANLAYLANPKATHPPPSLVTRSSLKTLRYVLRFVFWRLVRYAVRPTIISLAGSDPTPGHRTDTPLRPRPEIRHRRRRSRRARRDLCRRSAPLGRRSSRPERTCRRSNGRDHRPDQGAPLVLLALSLSLFLLLLPSGLWTHSFARRSSPGGIVATTSAKGGSPAGTATPEPTKRATRTRAPRRSTARRSVRSGPGAPRRSEAVWGQTEGNP